jgi:hypothetical protein
VSVAGDPAGLVLAHGADIDQLDLAAAMQLEDLGWGVIAHHLGKGSGRFREVDITMSMTFVLQSMYSAPPIQPHPAESPYVTRPGSGGPREAIRPQGRIAVNGTA